MQPPRRRRAAAPMLCALFAIAFALATILTRSWLHAPEARAPADAAGSPAPLAAAATALAAETTVTPPAALRQDATPAAPEPGFEARVDEIVRIGQRTAELAHQDDIEAARSSDRLARERLASLMETFDDAGEHALSMLVSVPEQTDEPRIAGRRVVLQLVLRGECERRDTAGDAAHDRSRIDAFVGAVLGVMPGTSITAEVGDAVLAKQRFMRAAHEPAVLELVRLASEGQFPRAIATSMLQTLWDNLQQFGERTSDEVSRLALLLLGEADASQRTAACRQLLRDPRYRTLVLAWLREHSDRTVATEIATIAANELPPSEALRVLRELSSLLRRAPTAYLALGFRAPEQVADSYRELLASDTQPDVRCNLITGVGMSRTPLGLEIATLALQNDPQPAARVQAAFAITAHGGAEAGERALLQLADDPAIAADTTHASALVLALENLENSADANTIERIARRLQMLPLFEDSRQRLDALVQRSLPGVKAR